MLWEVVILATPLTLALTATRAVVACAEPDHEIALAAHRIYLDSDDGKRAVVGVQKVGAVTLRDLSDFEMG